MSIFIDGMRVSEEHDVREGTAPGMGDGDLRVVASRVSVELQRAELLSRTAAAGESLPAEVRTAVREACVLRVRRLRAFFYGKPGEGNGTVAAQFFADPATWERARPALGAMLGFWLDEVGVVADAVLDRPEEGGLAEEKWPLVGFVSALAEAFDAFVEALPPERAAWFAARSVH